MSQDTASHREPGSLEDQRIIQCEPADFSDSFWRRFSKNKLALSGAVLVLFVFLISFLAPVISPYDPADINISEMLQAPSAKHWFGTDPLGRDILSRMIWGAQISLKVGFVSVGISLMIGVLLGMG